ncbi:MAG: glycosyltransferase family 61 protein, partial [Cyanobacteria bacterium P01_H01_bin.119]
EKIYFHCGFFGTSYQRQSLKKLGFRFWQLLDAKRYKSLRAGEIIAIKLSSERLNPTAQLCKMIRSAFVKQPVANPFRKIYLTREHVKSGRKVVNELELITLLKSNGFQVVIPGRLNVMAQARLFNESKFIISPHGASLANLAFCEPGVKVIELFNQHDRSTWSPLYSKISKACGLNLTSLAPQQIEGEGESHHRSNFYTDLNAIQAIIES